MPKSADDPAARVRQIAGQLHDLEERLRTASVDGRAGEPAGARGRAGGRGRAPARAGEPHVRRRERRRLP